MSICWSLDRVFFDLRRIHRSDVRSHILRELIKFLQNFQDDAKFYKNVNQIHILLSYFFDSLLEQFYSLDVRWHSLKMKWFICTRSILEAIWLLNSRYFYFQQFAVISCFYRCHETLIKIVRVEKINLRARDNVLNLNDVDEIILEYLTRFVNDFRVQKNCKFFSSCFKVLIELILLKIERVLSFSISFMNFEVHSFIFRTIALCNSRVFDKSSALHASTS